MSPSSHLPPESGEFYRPLIASARRAIARALGSRVELSVPERESVDAVTRVLGERSFGVFVTLLSGEGELRGCIGHMEGMCPTLEEEVAECAVAAALHDGRFAPVSLAELPSLSIELSILHPLETVSDRSELDCRVYGVMVSCGARRGVLLPELEGVDTVEDQLRIACRKGRIGFHENFEIERFRVVKVRA
jgi:AmmeMemoRadiSam system protein A